MMKILGWFKVQWPILMLIVGGLNLAAAVAFFYSDHFLLGVLFAVNVVIAIYATIEGVEK